MHPAQITAAIKMRGFTQIDIAAACGGINPASVWQVIQGRSRSKRIEMCIAAATEIPLAKLWPQWHGAAAPNRDRRSSAAERQKTLARALEILQKKAG